MDSAQHLKEQAFLDTYLVHRTPIFRFVWRMTGSIEIAEDVTQECFLVLAKGSHFDDGRSSLGAYLFGVARHIVYRRLRISAREIEDMADAPGPSETLDLILTQERAEQVRHAISNLPPLQREAIILFEYEEMSLENIANVTGSQVGAIKARLQRGRETLRKQLAPLLRHKTERTCL